MIVKSLLQIIQNKKIIEELKKKLQEQENLNKQYMFDIADLMNSVEQKTLLIQAWEDKWNNTQYNF